jgi:serine/threonine protein kinase
MIRFQPGIGSIDDPWQFLPFPVNRDRALYPQLENDAMNVDPKRVQAVFRMVVADADPAHQSAILDRECASDADLRQRVEAMVKEYEEGTTIAEQSQAKPLETPVPSLDGTEMSPAATDPAAITTRSPRQDQSAAGGGREENLGEVTLDFLQPTTKPGSLGRLGHNEVLEVLGRGAFGIVVRAFDEKLQRVVAIKVLSPQLAITSPARKRFLREARASGCVRHENVVQIYAVEEQPLPYLVMEYIPGQTLQQRVDQTGPLEPAEVLRIGEQIARGLAAAHAQGLIHRDIKPANILLEGGIDQKVKITDFGLARAADDASLTTSGVIAGTPLYMAPEQAKGDTLDPRADLFSLGSVLYTMVSGRPPFRASTALAVLKRVVEDTPRPIREIVPDVPQWLCDLIARLHAKDPAQRFQSAAEVADLFGRHLAHVQQPTLVARPQFARVGGQSKTRRIAVVAAAVVVVAAVGAALTYGPPWRSEAPPQVDKKSPADELAPAKVSANEILTSHVLQEPAAVSAALIDFDEPERPFGAEAYSNPIRRAERCNAFLVRFDLEKLGLAAKNQVAEAKVSFFVWDPSSSGNTKVCAFPLLTAWDPATVTWRQPSPGKSWRGGVGFAFAADTGPAGAEVVVKPEQGSDTAEPPIEYQLDVTDLVRAWLDGRTPNHGLAIAPVIDPSVDEGLLTRFQVCGSKYNRAEYTPKLTVQSRK